MFQIKLIVLAVVAFLLTTSAFANQIQSRIVQGHDAVRGQFPYYVFLRIRLPLGVSFCGGSLISNQWVLTAAHCLEDATGIQAHLGSLSAMDSWEFGRRIINVPPISDHLYVHPKYSSLRDINDIALIKLPSPVKFSHVIIPVNLACSSSNNVDVIAIGNGLMHTNDDDIAPILQYAEMKTISLLRCFPYIPRVAFSSSIICSQGEDKQSICDGDSGGPLVEVESQNLVGISAFGSAWFGCERGAPHAFTRVSAYLPWIENITGVACKK